jgi:hypothetical protein
MYMYIDDWDYKNVPLLSLLRNLKESTYKLRRKERKDSNAIVSQTTIKIPTPAFQPNIHVWAQDMS